MNIKLVKIIVTVPREYSVTLLDAIFAAGGGVIGDYTNCSVMTKVMGTFKPNENAKPFIGNYNKLECVEEDKIEVRCDISKVKEVIKVIREVHPYEEPVIDIIPLLVEEDLWVIYLLVMV